MTNYAFRRASRTNVNLLIGVAGGTGSGKTYTAMLLAKGIADGKPFAVIDTEAGRASHYADQFEFDVLELEPPFSPENYKNAIVSAEKAGYPVIVVDSMSHEYSGDGGILDMQEAEFQRMGYKEAAKMASWIKPKKEHKDMMSRLLQIRTHLILCFRAEAKVDMVKVDGKWQIVPKQSLTGLDGWIPITEKNVPFELTASFLLTADAPGMPKPIKLQQQHRALFPLDHPINEESGRLIAAWAGGGTPPDWRQDHRHAIETAVDMAALRGAFQAATGAAKKAGDAAALAEFTAIKDGRKSSLELAALPSAGSPTTAADSSETSHPAS
jgi:hypothetical protein